MIPSNIEREHIIKAIREIDSNEIPLGRESKKFCLIFEEKRYPPKYVLSLANRFANNKELNPSKFSGGQETNNFLKRLGFDIEETPSSGTFVKSISSQRKSCETTQKRHNERCPECKNTIKRMLKKIYGDVEINYKFEVSTNVEDYKDFSFYQKLKEILLELQKYRGHTDFVRARNLPRCDFFVPNPGFIVEFDESQHFTEPRKISLQKYPKNLKLGFSLRKWTALCEKINAKDNYPPFRDEQRAWYDTLRDFLPEIKCLKPTVRLYSKEMQWCSLNPENPRDIEKFRKLIENRLGRLSNWVATVVLRSNGEYSNEDRLEVLSQVVDLIAKKTDGDGVILFPGGWFSADKKGARSLYKLVEKQVRTILSKKDRIMIACLGIDGRKTSEWAKDQIGAAISREGIIALGRKFHPTLNEKENVNLASDHLEKEKDKSRVFKFGGRKYFICVCYDIFGIKQKRIPNFGIDVVLDLVHGFHPKGKGPSGAPNFARHGFAGVSTQWKCPVFGAAVFFNREIPERWPSGVYWDGGKTRNSECTYENISLKPVEDNMPLKVSEGVASVRIYNLDVI
ncbi:MAG: hypothetical protein PWQ87_513 [Candidatus Woesearchaeota archaeon]|nr:hypothetical protein [Candidatus Woesearchaeota archaeon]